MELSSEKGDVGQSVAALYVAISYLQSPQIIATQKKMKTDC